MRLLAIIYALLTLGCSRNEFAGVESLGDTSRVAAGTQIGKLKAGTVIIQQGRGNTAAATDNTKAGQRQGAAATAPQAAASTTTKQAGSPWWLLLVGALGGSLLGGWLRDWLAGLLPASWRSWLKW